MDVSRVVDSTGAPPEADLRIRRYRVISGCVECASDLTPLRKVPGVRDVRMLSATGVLAIHAPSTLDDKVLLRTASASGLTLEPEQPIARGGSPRARSRWWLRPELICLAIAAVLLVIGESHERLTGSDTVAVPVALVSIAVGIVYPLRTAWTMARNKKFSINVLLIVAVAGAIPLGRATEADCVVVIFSLGVVLESYVADKARKSIQKLMDLSPQRAERLRADGTVEPVAVEDLAVDDVVLVRPGSRLPTDGEVTQGASWIDASAITGESMPVEVGPGTTVYGGTLNGPAAVRIRVATPFQDTVLARVIREVEQAQQNKGRAQRFADRFAGVYTPLMITAAAVVAVSGPLLFGLSVGEAFYRALVVLIVSCSCSLVLSVPVSVVAAVARAAREGVLIKGGAYLERLAEVRAVAFDKTGTLTAGRPVLTSIHPLAELADDDLLGLAATVEAGATHPIADAVVRAARDRGIVVRPAVDVRVVAGIGAEARVDGQVVSVGRVGQLDDRAAVALAAIEDDGATPVALRRDGRLLGLIGVADELRPDAVRAVDGIRSLGVVHTVMLTGDRSRVARAIADRLGIETVRAELMPEDKSSAVTLAKAEFGTVAMVGDGTNDAPALATADVAIVMGAAGTDVALETADVALMADDLTKLPYTIALARRARRIIAQNVTLSIAAIVALAVAAMTGAFTLTEGVFLNEAYALLIIGNGLRLLNGRSLRHYSRPVGVPLRVAAVPDAQDASTCADDGCGCTAEPQLLTLSAPPSVPAEEPSCGCGVPAEQGRDSGVVNR